MLVTQYILYKNATPFISLKHFCKIVDSNVTTMFIN